MTRTVTGLVLAGLLAAACQGSIDNGPGKTGGKDDPVNPGMDPPTKPGDRPTPAPAGVSAGVAPLRRLTANQYRNTVRDLLGIEDPVPASALPADEVIEDRFYSNVVTPLKSIDLDKYASAAQLLAGKAMANLRGLLPGPANSINHGKINNLESKRPTCIQRATLSPGSIRS